MRSRAICLTRILALVAFLGLVPNDGAQKEALAQDLAASSRSSKFALTPPAHAFKKGAGNYYTRIVFEADGPSYSHIEVGDVLIPPGTTSEIAPFAGPALMELTTGNASFMTPNGREAVTAAAALRSM